MKRKTIANLTKKSIAIILVNYKEYANKYLPECYSSLARQSFKDFDLFIVDNDSRKSTKKFIEQTVPTAKIITTKQNLGWAGGNNIAIKKSQLKYNYFIFLNIDTTLDSNWLKELITYAKETDQGIIQSKIMLFNTNKINSFGNRINFLGIGYCNCFGKEQCPEVVNIDYTSGASMLVKKEVFQKIGLFSSEFFMYHDDLEFCWRARIAGFKLGIAQKSLCYHKYSFAGTMKYIYFMERNRLITLLSLESIKSILIILPILIPFELSMIIYLGLKGKLNEKVKSILYIFSPSGIKLIRTKRKEVKTYRSLKDKDIIKNFSGTVQNYQEQSLIFYKLANQILNFYWSIARRFI